MWVLYQYIYFKFYTYSYNIISYKYREKLWTEENGIFAAREREHKHKFAHSRFCRKIKETHKHTNRKHKIYYLFGKCGSDCNLKRAKYDAKAHLPIKIQFACNNNSSSLVVFIFGFCCVSFSLFYFRIQNLFDWRSTLHCKKTSVQKFLFAYFNKKKFVQFAMEIIE